MGTTTTFSKRQRFGSGFLAGLVAGIIASALMLLLSITVGGISLPEVFGSALIGWMPPSLFEYLHQLIGADAKFYLFDGIFVGQCLIFALCGGVYNLIVPIVKKDGEQLSWGDGLLLALILWLLTGLLFLPMTGAGVFGAALVSGAFNTMLSLAAVGLAFGLLFVLTQNWLVLRRLRAQGKPVEDIIEEQGLSRRVVLRRGIVIVGVGALGVLAWRFISGASAATAPVARLAQSFKSKIIPPPVPNYDTNFRLVEQLSQEVTPNEQFYLVSKNLFADPTVTTSEWQLKVYGLVEHPYTLNYSQLQALPMQQQYETLMCISNDVGGPYMSNALWKGVPLKDLLERAGGVKRGATKVVLHAYDNYTDSIHLSKALEPTTLVALEMNGATLPHEHGFPARLLVPGIYGMKHCKWMTGIEVVNYDFQGYWQQRGWSDPAPVRMTSRIDTPIAGVTIPANKPGYIAGVAFSGNKGISEVDVSLDGGQKWRRAALKRPLSDLTWVLWELPWKPAPGSYTIVVRAVDLEGNVQDPDVAPPLPNGSSGYHSIIVNVAQK
jgi:DMSO/TMAO reductase YedYZ molybdopterin-dependent catalytic subunit